MTGKNFIGYDLSAEGSLTFRTTQPSTGNQSSVEFIQASSDEVERAVLLASRAFQEFSHLLPSRRAEFLMAIANKIDALGDELISVFCFESGLTAERAEVEKNRTLFQLRSFAEALNKGDFFEASIDTKDDSLVPQKPDLRKILTGIGPVVVFGASNFPLAYSTAGGDTASALAAGCPVIVKSHPLHAGTGELVSLAIVEAARETGMPEGVFSNLNSINFSVGQQLVLHPLVKAVAFTGSLTGGRALLDLATSRPEPIPVFAEMGSTNPVFIFGSSLANHAEEIARSLSISITNAAGQFCTKPGLIFLEESAGSEEFIQRLGNQVASSVPATMLHHSIFERFEKGKLNAQKVEEKAIYQLADLGQLNAPSSMLLVVSATTFLAKADLRNEVFGPFSIVVRCKDKQEIARCAEYIEASLTASVFIEQDQASDISGLLNSLASKAGRLIFNGVPTGVTVCPSMNHGGPYPATTDARFTAVGIDSMRRFLRPLTFQNFPQQLLPQVLRDKNEGLVLRRINGDWSRDDVVI